MKILLVDQFSSMGGAQHSFADLLPAFREQGWEVQAALPGDGPLTKLVPTTSIPCGPYKSGTKSASDMARFGRDMARQSFILRTLVRDCDLVYVNGPRVLPAAAWATPSSVPLLFHAHNYLDQSYSARLAQLSLRRARAHVVACSDFVANPLRPACSRLSVLRNGVSDLGFRVRHFAKPWRIGIIGRIEEQKGQTDFLEAARDIDDAEFIVHGEPSEHSGRYFSFCKALAANLRVQFAGFTCDLPSMYRNLDLLVVPSKQEGLGRVILEAFSAGVPVLAYAAGGIPEVIENNETGFLLKKRTPRALASRINELLRGDESALRRVAIRARLAWELRYTVNEYRRRMLTAIIETSRRQ